MEAADPGLGAVPDSHDWEEKDLSAPSRSVKEFSGTDKDGNQFSVVIDLTLNFTYVDITSVRVCRRCGQESVNGREPKESCDTAQVRDVMER